MFEGKVLPQETKWQVAKARLNLARIEGLGKQQDLFLAGLEQDGIDKFGAKNELSKI
jgi:hypothetical protein